MPKPHLGLLLDSLRYRHERTKPVLSWHLNKASLVAHRATAHLARSLEVLPEVGVASPSDLAAMMELPLATAQHYFAEARALKEFIERDSIVTGPERVVVVAPERSVSRIVTIGFEYTLQEAPGSPRAFESGRCAERELKKLEDAEAWGNSIAPLLLAWSKAILARRRLVLAGNEVSKRCGGLSAHVLEPSPLQPFVSSMLLVLPSEKAKNTILSELSNRGILAHCRKRIPDVFRQCDDGSREIVISDIQSANFRRLLAEWCLQK